MDSGESAADVPSSEEIACRLVDKLAPGDLRPSGRTDWTSIIKRALCSVGKEYGYSCWPFEDSGGQFREEFLTDAGWYYGGGGKSRYGLVLVAESELDPYRWEEIDLDFDKLLHIKAPRKLFAFRSQSGKSHAKAHQSICGFLKSYEQHLAGEEFMFIELQNLEPSYVHIYGYSTGKVTNAFYPLNIKSLGDIKIKIGGVCSEADQFIQS